MENNLPNGWEEAELSLLVHYKKGKKPKRMESKPFNNSLVYLDIRAIEKKNDEIFVDSETSNSTDENELIVVWDGARAGWVGKSRKGALGSTLMGLRPRINKDYLFRFLQTQFDYLQTNHRGTGIPHVDPDIFWNIKVPIAPEAEQQRIVAKLDELLEKIDRSRARLERIPKILKRFRRSILAAAVSGKLTLDWRETNFQMENGKELVLRSKEVRKRRYKAACESAVNEGKRRPTDFDNYDVNLKNDFDLFKIPNSWNWVDFRFVMSEDEPFCYGVVQPGNESKNGNFLIRAGDLKNNTVDTSALRTISKTIDKEYSRSKINGGEILITVVGAGIGECGIVPTSCKGYNIARAVAKVPIKDFNSKYILWWLNSSVANKWMKNEAREVARPTLNLEQLRTIPLPLPPIDEQKEITRRIDLLFALADKIEARYNKAKAQIDQLPQSLLTKAFRGELVAQDPKDEAAGVLLNRIQSEKEPRTVRNSKKARTYKLKSDLSLAAED